MISGGSRQRGHLWNMRLLHVRVLYNGHLSAHTPIRPSARAAAEWVILGVGVGRGPGEGRVGGIAGDLCFVPSSRVTLVPRAPPDRPVP